MAHIVVIFSIVTFYVLNSEGLVPTYKLCADSNCKEVISIAKTILRYVPSDRRNLNFQSGETVKVFSKMSYLWYVEINGKRGYAPKTFLRESKVFVPNRKLIAVSDVENDTLKNTSDVHTGQPVKEMSEKTAVSSSDFEQQQYNPLLNITQPYSVLDGTTVYQLANEGSPIKATVPDTDIKPTEEFYIPENIQTAMPASDKSKLTSPIEPKGKNIEQVLQVKDIQEKILTSSEMEEENDREYVADEQEEEEGDEEEEEEEEEEEGDEEEEEEEEEEVAEVTGNSTLMQKLDKAENVTNLYGEQKSQTGVELKQATVNFTEQPSESLSQVESDQVSASSTKQISESLLQVEPYQVVESAREEISESQSQVESDQVTVSSTKQISESSVLDVEPHQVRASPIQETCESQSQVEPDQVIASPTEETSESQSQVELHQVVESATGETSESQSQVESDQVTVSSTKQISESSVLDVEPHQVRASPIQETFESQSQVEPDQVKVSPTEETSESQSQVELHQVVESATEETSESQSKIESDQVTVSPTEETFESQSQIESDQVKVSPTEETFESQSQIESDQVTVSPPEETYEFQPKDKVLICPTEEECESQSNVDISDVVTEQSSFRDDEASEAESIFSGVGNFFSHLIFDFLKETDVLHPGEETAMDDNLQDRKTTHDALRFPENKDTNAAVCDSGLTASCLAKPGSNPTNEQLPLVVEQLLVSNANSKMNEEKTSVDKFLYLMVTAVTVLLFSLGYYYIEKIQRDGSLVAKINSLEKTLLVASKENFILKDNLEEAKEKLRTMENSSCDSNEVATLLQRELEESKVSHVELEEQVASLEKELEAATEAGLELNRMLSDFLSAQHGSDSLMKSVEHLQKQLDDQQGTITAMNASLSSKSIENEGLQADLNAATEKITLLQEEVLKLQENVSCMQKEKQEMEHELCQKNQSIEKQLVEALESKSAESQRLCRELDSLQEALDECRRTLASKDCELAVLQDCLRQTDVGGEGGGDASNKLEKLMDLGHAHAELALMVKERDSLQEKLQGEEDARKLLEDHVRIVSEEVASLRTKYQDAEREKLEAQRRLEVLSEYFKEKETQLQKELGLQGAMYIKKEGDALSTFEQIKSLQEEVENYNGTLVIDSDADVDSTFNKIYNENMLANDGTSVETSPQMMKKAKVRFVTDDPGSQNETLKKEIIDQERGLKAQIATLEKKVHENWVVARQAERRLEESKQESGQLRNRLTLVERNLLNASQSVDVPQHNERAAESNGELPLSPLPVGLGDLQDLPASPLHYGHPSSPPLLPLSVQPLPHLPLPRMPPPGMFVPPPPPGMHFLPPMSSGRHPGDRRLPPVGCMSSPPPEPRGSFSPYDRSPPPSPPGRSYHSPTLRYDDSPERYRHRSPPPHNSHPFSPIHRSWDDHNGPPRSSFRPLRRESPRETKGSTLSSGHSSESIDKCSRHSGRV